MRPIVNTEKRIQQYSLSQALPAETIARVIASAVAISDVSTPTEVPPGTRVSAVFVELWVQSSGQQPVFGNMIIEKVPSGLSSISNTEAQSMNSYPNKKNIFYTTQGLIGDANANPIPIIRQWIKIPKSKQRMGLGDRLVMSVTNLDPSGDNIEFCGLAIWKAQF